MKVSSSAMPAVYSRVRKLPPANTITARYASVTARTTALAVSGDRVRSETSLTLSGMIRSNDHANRLRVAIRKVAGSATMNATMNETLMITVSTVEPVSIETKKKNDEAAGSV